MQHIRPILLGLVISCGGYSFDDDPNVKQPLTTGSPTGLINAFEAGYSIDMMGRRTDYFVPGRGIEIQNPQYTALDADKPQGLLFEFNVVRCARVECPDEGYKLVGHRYTQPATGGEPPELFGEKFRGPVGDPPVYELVMWLKDNPNGKFASENPTVQAPPWWPEFFATWRALADQYPTPQAAVAGGYSFMFAQRNDGTLADCVYNRQQANGFRGTGGMGHHYVRLDMVNTDPASIGGTKPQGLLFMQKLDKSWIVGGVEWLLWAQRQPLPQVYDIPFDGPMAGHQNTQPEHFDLHAYPGYLNPDGLFSTWNRAAQCPLTP